MSFQDSAVYQRLNPPHSPALIASTEKVRDVKISPDGRCILYQVQPFYKVDRTTAALWLARTDVEQSARQLTSGEFNDKAAVWHPNGKRVVFLSDRHSPGKSPLLYTVLVEASIDTEPVVLSTGFGKKGVQAFDISPDGKYIAFTSVDDPTDEDLKKFQEKDDAREYGSKSGLSRLRLYDFATQNISTTQGIRQDMHVESFTWSPDSKELLYRLRQNRGSEYSEMEIVVERIMIDGFECPKSVSSYPRSPSGPNIWLSSGHVATLQSYEPHNSLDARTLFGQRIDQNWRVDKSAKRVAKLYGVTEDAVRIVNLGASSAGDGMVAVEVCKDVDTHIDVVLFSKHDVKTLFTLFQTNEEAIWFGAWDAKKVLTESGEVSFVFAAVLSSGIRHQPPNVWAGRVVGSNGGTVLEKLRLSSHLQWLTDAPMIKAEVIHWKATDGTQLNGVVRYPPGYSASSGVLPTILFIHGGPYRRDIPDYMPYFCNWRELLASAGYLVVSANYRGSQGRGHQFAHAANYGVGVHDWADCESMVDEVIRRGIADPQRLGVAGWSHGGSLTAWGVTQTKSRFRAAIVGAGATNWEGMVMESGSPELEAAIGRSVPWDHSGALQSIRKNSPVHSISGVTTAVLILHGEKDERVPVAQALGFWRGLKRKAEGRAREAAQMVVYPREPHGFVERKHAEDVLRRVLEHFNNYL
ncbi:Alpha/Beta hydrolase protein [Crucibulum laeve]|uniref:Dipeptidyl-peptidase V n=1 Tax=Crucibulum laeve TaxID=68775 RepID=A0A5C3LGL3_9AGAR|nr:Alpha/Beta hydrolase protein [Crucibulum laeve]